MLDELVIYGILVFVGGVATASELYSDPNIGTFATIAMLMLAAGIVGMVRSWLHRPRLPRARVWRRRA
jgi:hypothetical protein